MSLVFIVLIAIAAVAALLLIAAFWRMMICFPAKKAVYRPVPDQARGDLYARKLSRMIRCDTVSGEDDPDPDKFLRFHAVLAELFPLVHAELVKTEVDGNLLFFWKGKHSSKSVVLMSHQDTVPAEGDWKYGPFSGAIEEGRVWGRGAVDTKCSVMGFFQAVEELLGEGFVPEQDIYLSSSCTEESCGGGCEKLVALLEQKGVTPFLVCDEGGGIMTDPVPFIKGNFAMIGVQEKGNADLRVTARSHGGHGSTPFRHSPIPVLAAFENSLEHHNPFERKLDGPVRAMLEDMAPYGTFPARFVFSNLWLFGKLLAHVMSSISPQAAAMLQSTAAFTMQSGSQAWNVIPQEAWVGVNVRFIPHQPKESTLKILEGIAVKHKVEMEVLHAEDVSDMADLHSDAWKLLTACVEKTFPGIGISPYLMTGGTDARHYERICPNVLRFAPVMMGPEEKKGIHAADESISVDCLPGCVDFYKNLISSL